MIILSTCIAFALWRYHHKRKWLDEQKEYEEKTRLSPSGPPKPERYIYRGGTGSLPPKLGEPPRTYHVTSSQYSLFPNRYGSSGGLQYCTLPRPPGSRRVSPSPAGSRGSTLERTGMDTMDTSQGYLGASSSGGQYLGQSTRSGLYPSSMNSSQHSVLSERSRLASMEDLTEDELDCKYTLGFTWFFTSNKIHSIIDLRLYSPISNTSGQRVPKTSTGQGH